MMIKLAWRVVRHILTRIPKSECAGVGDGRGMAEGWLIVAGIVLGGLALVPYSRKRHESRKVTKSMPYCVVDRFRVNTRKPNRYRQSKEILNF